MVLGAKEELLALMAARLGDQVAGPVGQGESAAVAGVSSAAALHPELEPESCLKNSFFGIRSLNGTTEENNRICTTAQTVATC